LSSVEVSGLITVDLSSFRISSGCMEKDPFGFGLFSISGSVQFFIFFVVNDKKACG
jgi:hypothetical protein